MQIVTNVPDLRQAINNWRLAGQRLAFVPTMGNLHDGHLKLVSAAKKHADKVIVSIFVNPTQFGPGEDFASYPRTEQADQHKLSAAQTDLLFMPQVAEMYPTATKTVVSVAGVTEHYCGASRPGHFDGVATVVCKLFNMVQPDLALFGLKDFQQLTVIRTMVRDLNIPIDIIGVDTVREANGLAMSSRNGYLTDSQKTLAANLYQILCSARSAVLAGKQSYAAIEQQAVQDLQNIGLQPDYFAVCRQSDLAKAEQNELDLVILAAVKLGATRLIDNVYFSKASTPNLAQAG
ncbi:MAG: pantoate--beta-alanine ligase [Methylococcales bacterium]